MTRGTFSAAAAFGLFSACFASGSARNAVAPRAPTENSSSIVRTAAAQIGIDFNRDGTPDVGVVSRGRIRVTLSQRGTMLLRNARHIVRLAAGDVDGDGDPDLVALTRRGKLRVFHNDGSGHFVRARSRPHSAGLKHPSQRGVTENPAPGAFESSHRTTVPLMPARIAGWPGWDRAGPWAQRDAPDCPVTIPSGPSRSPPLA